MVAGRVASTINFAIEHMPKVDLRVGRRPFLR